MDGGIFKETILTWYFVWLGNTFGRSENDNDDDDDDKQNENNFVNPAYRFIDWRRSTARERLRHLGPGRAGS